MRKFVDWDVPAAMLGLLGVAWGKAVSINSNTKKNNYYGERYCVCCLNYKGKEVEGRELKLHRLTANEKLRKVSGRCSVKLVKKVTAYLPLQSAQLCFILFYLLYFGQNSFSILMLLKIGMGGVYLKRIHNKITNPMCYHYCFYATMRHAA